MVIALLLQLAVAVIASGSWGDYYLDPVSLWNANLWKNRSQFPVCQSAAFRNPARSFIS